MSGYSRDRANSRGQPYPGSHASSFSNTSPTSGRRESRDQPLVLQSRDGRSGRTSRDADYDDYPSGRRDIEIASSNRSYTADGSQRRSRRYSNTGPRNRRMSDAPRTSRLSDQNRRDVFDEEEDRDTSRYSRESESRRGDDYDLTSSPTSLADTRRHWDEPTESGRGSIDDDRTEYPGSQHRDVAVPRSRGYSLDQSGSTSFVLRGSDRFSTDLVREAISSIIRGREQVRMKRNSSTVSRSITIKLLRRHF